MPNNLIIRHFLCIFVLVNLFIMEELELKIPKSCVYNVGIGWKEDNKNQKYIFGDTNDSANWDEFSIPLPEGDWKISKKSEDYSEITIQKNNI